METLTKPQSDQDTDLTGSRLDRMDPGIFRNQRSLDDEPTDEDTEQDLPDDEPVDEDGDPTGEHDHHQDDNYALGGHVTRSSGA